MIIVFYRCWCSKMKIPNAYKLEGRKNDPKAQQRKSNTCTYLLYTLEVMIQTGELVYKCNKFTFLELFNETYLAKMSKELGPTR